MPARAAERIVALDLVRGVAVMGIVLMNIQSFAMPEAAYLNPAAYGGANGANLAVWVAELILVDGKMRGLFSWLFGASLLIVVDRAGPEAAAVHYRRMAWLFVFGLLHFLLVWDGDILMHYALVGSIAFAWRRRAPHQLVAAALVLLLLQLFLDLGTPVAADQLATLVHTPHASAGDVHQLAELHDQFGAPPANAIRAEIARHHAPWLSLLAYRSAELSRLIVGTLISVGFETLAYMLLGMAALKTGLLSGEWEAARYRRWAMIGLGGGALGFAMLAAWVMAAGFDFRVVAWEVLVCSAPLRPPMIVGWACLILLAARPGGWLTMRIAAAGRVAFTNYLGTSLVCAALFDGANRFGRFSRAELLLVVMAIWLAMIAWSAPWLRRFRYGPFEWAWRSLARGTVQPLRR